MREADRLESRFIQGVRLAVRYIARFEQPVGVEIDDQPLRRSGGLPGAVGGKKPACRHTDADRSGEWQAQRPFHHVSPPNRTIGHYRYIPVKGDIQAGKAWKIHGIKAENMFSAR